MTGKIYRDRYESIPKRNFRNAIIKLCEENYKLLGSRKVLGDQDKVRVTLTLDGGMRILR